MSSGTSVIGAPRLQNNFGRFGIAHDVVFSQRQIEAVYTTHHTAHNGQVGDIFDKAWLLLKGEGDIG